MCQNGLGVVRNEVRAFQMMKAAAEQDYPIAQHGIGFMYLEGDCVEQDSRITSYNVCYTKLLRPAEAAPSRNWPVAMICRAAASCCRSSTLCIRVSISVLSCRRVR